MVNVKVFKAKPGREGWMRVIEILKGKGIDILMKTEKADVSIVLSGAAENAGILEGRKILMYNIKDWMEKEPEQLEQFKFDLWRPILEEYYDEFINLSGMSDKMKAKEILNKIREVQNDSQKRGNSN